MESRTDGSIPIEYYPNPIGISQIMDNLNVVTEILDASCSSDKCLGLSFQQVNNLMKAKELLREVIHPRDTSSYNSFDSYDSRTYKNKRW